MTLAITLFLLVAGLEVDLSTIWRQKAGYQCRRGWRCSSFAVVSARPGMPAADGARSWCRSAAVRLFMATALSISHCR